MTKKQHIVTATVAPPENHWKILRIIEDAYIRWKKNFLSYFFTTLLIIAIWIGIHAGLIIIEVFAALIGIVFFKSSLLAIITAGIAILASVLVSFYLYFLFILTSVKIFTQNTISPIQAIKSASPLVRGYIWIGIISALFLSGLFPFGILTFSIITLLWSFWSTFTTFVYLECQKKGLQNLWISQTMYNQKFRLLFIRSLIPLGVSLLISVPHWLALWKTGELGLIYNIFYILTFIFNFLFMSYLICYNYELYKKLNIPKSVKTPKVWIGISLGGWIINILLIASLSFLIIKMLPIIRNYYMHLGTSRANIKLGKHNSSILYYSATVGRSVQTIDRIFTLESIKTNFHPSQYDELTNSEEFIVTNVSIKNTSQQTIENSTYDFFIQTANGDLIGPSFSFQLADHDLLGTGKLTQGAKKSGAVVFKVDKSNKPFTLLYKPHILDIVKSYVIKAKI